MHRACIEETWWLDTVAQMAKQFEMQKLFNLNFPGIIATTEVLQAFSSDNVTFQQIRTNELNILYSYRIN